MRRIREAKALPISRRCRIACADGGQHQRYGFGRAVDRMRGHQLRKRNAHDLLKMNCVAADFKLGRLGE